VVTPAVKREAVAHLRQAHDLSERRACRVIGCVRMTVRYRSRPIDDAGLRERLRTLAKERRRFGYRRLHVLLRREGLRRKSQAAVSHLSGRTADGAQAPGPQKSLGTRAPIPVPLQPNDRWSLDFVSDQLACGRRFRILAVFDDCTREDLLIGSRGRPRLSSATTARS
jgi:putative transposase